MSIFNEIKKILHKENSSKLSELTYKFYIDQGKVLESHNQKNIVQTCVVYIPIEYEEGYIYDHDLESASIISQEIIMICFDSHIKQFKSFYELKTNYLICLIDDITFKTNVIKNIIETKFRISTLDYAK